MVKESNKSKGRLEPVLKPIGVLPMIQLYWTPSARCNLEAYSNVSATDVELYARALNLLEISLFTVQDCAKRKAMQSKNVSSCVQHEHLVITGSPKCAACGVAI